MKFNDFLNTDSLQSITTITSVYWHKVRVHENKRTTNRAAYEHIIPQYLTPKQKIIAYRNGKADFRFTRHS